MAQSVEYKLTENEERNNNKPDQVSTSMYTDVRKIIQELGVKPRSNEARDSCNGPKIDGFGRIR